MQKITQRGLAHYVVRPWQAIRQLLMFLHTRPHRRPVVFIVGPPRSGTTLLQTILLEHSRCNGFRAETRIFSWRPLGAYWRFSHMVEAEHHAAAWRHAGTDIGRFFLAMHEAVVPPGEDAVIVEKTPQHALRANWIARVFPEARFICLVRDPRDAFASAKRSGIIVQARRGVTAYARYWRRCIRQPSALPAERVRFLRYEDLVTDPPAEVGSLMAWLGLAMEDAQLSGTRRREDARSRAQAFSRLADDIGADTVGRWRDVLTPQEVATIERIGGQEMRRLGYLQG